MPSQSSIYVSEIQIQQKLYLKITRLPNTQQMFLLLYMCNTNSSFFFLKSLNKQSLNLHLQFPLAHQYTSVFSSSSRRIEESSHQEQKEARGAPLILIVGRGQWSSKFSSTNKRKLTNKLFTYIHAWPPFFSISLHWDEIGKLRFCLLWDTGQFRLRVRYMFQHWYTIKANDNRESLLFAFFCFVFCLLSFWHFFYFSSTKKI